MPFGSTRWPGRPRPPPRHGDVRPRIKALPPRAHQHPWICRSDQAILSLFSFLCSEDHVVSEYCQMAVLKQVTGDLAGTLVDLKNDVTVIGSLPECDIVLAANGVSRRHAEIRKVGPAFFLVDLDSRNKTLVNDTELKAGVEHLLKENDRINICGVEFVY